MHDPRRLEKGALVLLYWTDASGNGDAKWMPPEDAVVKPSKNETVGWVTHLTDVAVTVIHNRDRTHNNVHGDMTIPFSAITKVRFLGKRHE